MRVCQTATLVAAFALLAGCSRGDRSTADSAASDVSVEQAGDPGDGSVRDTDGFSLTLSDDMEASDEGEVATFCRQQAPAAFAPAERLELVLASSRFTLVIRRVGDALAPGTLWLGDDRGFYAMLAQPSGDDLAAWRFFEARRGSIHVTSLGDGQLRGRYDITFVDLDSGDDFDAEGDFQATADEDCGRIAE